MNTVIYNQKEIPCLPEYDVVVVGGGFAGFSAAIAAATSGVRTLLVERSGALGGMATLAGVPNFCTVTGETLMGHGWVWNGIVGRMRALHAIGEENGYYVKHNEAIQTVDYGFSASALEMALLHMAKKSGVSLLLQTEVVDVKAEDGSVTHVIVHNESLLQAIAAKVVIDGSGNGVVALHSGAKQLPDQEGTKPIPPAFRIFLHKGENPDLLQPTEEMTEEPLPYSVQPLPGGSVMLKINLKEEQTTNAEERNTLELLTKSRVLSTVEDFKRKHGANYYYNGIPAILPIREMRRIEGEYVLTAEDVRAGRRFDDAVATGSFIIDTLYHHERIPSYDIPYRSLLARYTKNLLVVGRCFSADRYAMASARIMKTASQMGEAAGAAAAISCQRNTALRSIQASEITQLLQTAFS